MGRFRRLVFIAGGLVLLAGLLAVVSPRVGGIEGRGAVTPRGAVVSVAVEALPVSCRARAVSRAASQTTCERHVDPAANSR